MTEGRAGFDYGGIEAGAVATMSSRPGAGFQPGTGPSFTYVPVPDNLVIAPISGPVISQPGGIFIKPPSGAQPACAAGQTGYYVYDPNGLFVGVVCVPNTTVAPSAPALVPERALAEEASSRQPWPRLTVGISPDVGITGLDSWFWLGPGGATMPEVSASAGPLTVTVRATLVNVSWDTGDGKRYDSGVDLGQPYPARSSIRHTYQTDSYQRPEGYRVGATVRFGVWYAVNGGPWQFLGTKARTYSTAYRVHQIQPEGVPAKP